MYEFEIIRLSFNFQYLGVDKSNVYTIEFQLLDPRLFPLCHEEIRC